jgi:D-alanyl-D-alanine carboxypeptidase
MARRSPSGLAWCAVSVLALCAGACTTVPAQRAASTASSGTAEVPGSSTPSAAFLDRAEASVRTGVASYAGRGDAAMVTLIRDGAQTRVVTAGFADAAKRDPVTAQDRFRIASITKSMVATAVLQYAASGRLRLDDPVVRWLPGLLPNRQITIRHLLSHRSGLHELTEQEYASAKIRSDRDLIAATVKHPLDFTPGSDGAYSNTGYVVLGLLVEKLSGQPLQAALHRAVFEPAGMRSTTLGGTPTVVPRSGGVFIQNEGLDGVGMAAGGVVSTAGDVDRFYERLFSGGFLPSGLVATMGSPTGTVPFSQGEYGLGLWIWSLSCGEGLGHSGALTGYTTKVWTLKGSDRRAVVLVDDGQAQSFADNIADDALCP